MNTIVLKKYNLAMRVMHWFMAVIVICALSSGIYMVNLSADNPNKFMFYPLHKSLGVLIGVLVVLRLAVRFSSKIPELPAIFSSNKIMLARISFFLLYLCMIAMPVSGYMMSNAAGMVVLFFGIPMPSVIARTTELLVVFQKVHEVVGYCTAVAVVAHVSHAFKHLLFDKVNLFYRM